jgi:hypothetical protein
VFGLPRSALAIDADSVSLTLTGATLDGLAIEGNDIVTIVP